MINATEKDIARFMSYVDKLPNGCWYWTGARSRGKGNRKWYGSFNVGGRVVRAHRFASEVLGQQTCPPGFHRDHECHFSMCVNPRHIEIVTHEENQQRKTARRKKEALNCMPCWSSPSSSPRFCCGHSRLDCSH